MGEMQHVTTGSMKLTPEPLQGRHVRLEPLSAVHDAPLRAACDADPDIWSLYPFSMQGEHYGRWRAGVDRRVAAGEAIAFAVIVEGRCGGVTLYTTVDAPNRRVEIGNTYFHPELRGGVANPESKLLLLDHAFASGATCVQFRVDALNARSRAAMTKLGAHLDGVLRQDRITWTGRVRDTVIFSILTDEWSELRNRLTTRID
jgi:RimJ/RimL family protein N-acetyltransferase